MYNVCVAIIILKQLWMLQAANEEDPAVLYMTLQQGSSLLIRLLQFGSTFPFTPVGSGMIPFENLVFFRPSKEETSL